VDPCMDPPSFIWINVRETRNGQIAPLYDLKGRPTLAAGGVTGAMGAMGATMVSSSLATARESLPPLAEDIACPHAR
jgi:hypothetical protein